MFQQEQQRLQLEKEDLHQERLQRLEEQKQQLQFEGQRLQKNQLLEVFELVEEGRRRILGAKFTKTQLTHDLFESTEENELKNVLSQLSTASPEAESQKVTDWVHNGLVENKNQSQLKVAVADPSACAFVHPTPMGFSFAVNPEGELSILLFSMTYPATQHLRFINNRVQLGLFVACW